MKKYIKPTIEKEVVAIESVIMAGSISDNGDGTKNVSVGGEFNGGELQGNEGSSVWDED